MTASRNTIPKLKGVIDSLTEALEKYGAHLLPSCYDDDGTVTACKCGLMDILDKARTQYELRSKTRREREEHSLRNGVRS